MPSLKDKIKSLLSKSKKRLSTQKSVAPATTTPTAAQNASAPASASATASPATPAVKPEERAVVNAVAVPATTSGNLTVLLKNDSNSSTVFAYITGSAIDNNYAVFLLSADARTPYYPASPSTNGASLSENVSIPLGAPGNTVTATIPRLAGARIWFSIGAPLVFALNPGPGLVEPSVFNGSDPNINTNFGFMEFTYNSSQVFANISYVDFVGLPISLTLTDTTGTSQHVSGLPVNGLETIATRLRAQSAKDGQQWGSLVVTHNNQDLRVLSPNSGITLNSTWFQNYWTEYLDAVWEKYTAQPLTINTQASFGNVTGQVNSSGLLDFGNGVTFAKPSAADIFSCSTGPFATDSNALRNVIIPRLSAAINRTTLLRASSQPNGANGTMYYTYTTTNHYAGFVHDANLDHHGYAFPYDDVTPDGHVPQEGALSSGSPASMTVTVGGVHAYI